MLYPGIGHEEQIMKETFLCYLEKADAVNPQSAADYIHVEL